MSPQGGSILLAVACSSNATEVAMPCATTRVSASAPTCYAFVERP